MLRNLPSFKALGGVGSMVIILGKLFISVTTAFICQIILQNSTKLATLLYTPVLPVIIIFIVSYFMGSMFISVYGTSADAILHCYCLDEELHAEI